MNILVMWKLIFILGCMQKKKKKKSQYYPFLSYLVKINGRGKKNLILKNGQRTWTGISPKKIEIAITH